MVALSLRKVSFHSEVFAPILKSKTDIHTYKQTNKQTNKINRTVLEMPILLSKLISFDLKYSILIMAPPHLDTHISNRPQKYFRILAHKCLPYPNF